MVCAPGCPRSHARRSCWARVVWHPCVACRSRAQPPPAARLPGAALQLHPGLQPQVAVAVHQARGCAGLRGERRRRRLRQAAPRPGGVAEGVRQHQQQHPVRLWHRQLERGPGHGHPDGHHVKGREPGGRVRAVDPDQPERLRGLPERQPPHAHDVQRAAHHAAGPRPRELPGGRSIRRFGAFSAPCLVVFFFFFVSGSLPRLRSPAAAAPRLVSFRSLAAAAAGGSLACA